MNTLNRDAYLAHIREKIENGRFRDNWESLSQYRTPDWFRDAKFGIFIHWGVYSVPAFGSEWQTDTACAYNSWCYTAENRFKDPTGILCDFVDIVSKNGCLLLNIGPRADGTITDEDKNILLTIGKWLKINGEAIYGSRPWRVSAEGPTEIPEGQFTDGKQKKFTPRDVRYTCRGGHIYAFVLSFPENGEVAFPALGERDASSKPNFHGSIRNVTALGFAEAPEWFRREDALHVKTKSIHSDAPVVFKIDVE